jgi:hypothetical protein
VTVLGLAANWEQWPLVTRMLDLNPKANIDATQTEGPRHGETVLWYSAFHEQWPLVARMLELNPKANVDTMSQEGPNSGKTVLWLMATFQQWPLVAQILFRQPNANIFARPAQGRDVGKDVVWYVREAAPVPLKKLLVIHEMNRDVPGQDLASRLNPAHLGMPAIVEGVTKLFRNATVAFTNLMTERMVQEESAFDNMPQELKRTFVLNYLRGAFPEGSQHDEGDADLMQVPDNMLMDLLARFHKVFKDVDYKGRSVEVVAAKVLHYLAPIHNREDASEARIKIIKRVRGWIIDEVAEAIRTKRLPDRIDQDLRNQLTAALSRKTLNSITPKWIKEAVDQVVAAQGGEERPEQPNLKKRERGDDTNDLQKTKN